MKPIHKFNNGNGATLCNCCSKIISIGLTEDLYCSEECKLKYKNIKIVIMTPKEKAEELVNRFIYRRTDYVEIDDAKQCALIAIDEMLSLRYLLKKETYFYNEVKQEIESL